LTKKPKTTHNPAQNGVELIQRLLSILCLMRSNDNGRIPISLDSFQDIVPGLVTCHFVTPPPSDLEEVTADPKKEITVTTFIELVFMPFEEGETPVRPLNQLTIALLPEWLGQIVVSTQALTQIRLYGAENENGQRYGRAKCVAIFSGDTILSLLPLAA